MDIQEKASKYFKENPKEKEVHITQEGFMFKREYLARQHNTTLPEGSEVQSFTNGLIAEEVLEDQTSPSGMAATQKQSVADLAKIAADKKKADAKKAETAKKSDSAKKLAEVKKIAAAAKKKITEAKTSAETTTTETEKDPASDDKSK